MQHLDPMEYTISLDSRSLHAQSSPDTSVTTQSTLAQPSATSRCEARSCSSPQALGHSTEERPLAAAVCPTKPRSKKPYQTKPLTFCTPGPRMIVEAESSSSATSRPPLRSRAVLPTPVPNLIKKSRGRHVPTDAAEVETDGSVMGRHYVCPVDACGKRFGRGEHLKRHIRSIHTNEKPFKCTHASCKKTFNRHDNLLQHLKVHQESSPLPAPPGPYTAPFQVIQEHPKKPSSPPEPDNRPPSPSQQPHPSAQSFMNEYSLLPIPSPNLSLHPPTNMAVSSLRTELACSPPSTSHETGYDFSHANHGAPPAELHHHDSYLRSPFVSPWTLASPHTQNGR